jgi:carboxyl-terminal processing protease
MSKRFVTVFFVLTCLALLFQFQSLGKTDPGDDTKARHTEILKNVTVLLEEGHYSPKKVDDAFSQLVWKEFLEELDDEKDVFLKTDIESFRKFEKSIDNEMRGETLRSFYAIEEVYLKRVQEVATIYKDILKTPMNFQSKEMVQMDPDKLDFPQSLNDRYQTWRKRLKYAVLSKYVELLEEQEKNKEKKEMLKADSTLEREARDQVRRQMERYFTSKIKRETEDELFSVFINTITSAMDPHTNYYPPVDTRTFNESMSGRFFGIGALLKDEDGHIKISSLTSGGPAWKSGELKENDEIIKVGQGAEEPVDITGYAIPDAVKLIRGATKGSEVRLTIKRPDGSIKVVKLLRDDIKLEDTFAKSAIIQGDHKIGYIYLPEFYADFERSGGARCAVDVAKEVEKLKAEKVEGIILDLRGNGGGSLYDVVQIAGLFIKEGPVCQVQGRGESPNILRDRDEKVQYDGPLAVMVDGTSASASEIFAAAIQDYQRGIVIGSSSTYGKGTVQRMIGLSPDRDILFGDKKKEDLGNVKLTLQKFYRINGGATQLRGVTPDIILPDRFDYMKFREKDNPRALPWDVIEKAEYNPVQRDLSGIITQANKALPTNMTFSKIRESVQMLDKLNQKEYDLQLSQYRDDQKKLKAVFKELDEHYKSKNSLNIRNLYSDTTDIQSSTEKVDKNKQWMKFRLNDVYIQYSVSVLDGWIERDRLAKKG